MYGIIDTMPYCRRGELRRGARQPHTHTQAWHIDTRSRSAIDRGRARATETTDTST